MGGSQSVEEKITSVATDSSVYIDNDSSALEEAGESSGGKLAVAAVSALAASSALI
jgi:hypothetical protein